MKTEVDINFKVLEWSIHRAGLNIDKLEIKFPNLKKWIGGTKKPTIKQLESFSKTVYFPFGYFFLTELPMEKLPISFFRTEKNLSIPLSIDVQDMILLLQQRQDWLKNYLKDNDYEPLKFVGKFKKENDIDKIVSDIRKNLGMEKNWANKQKNWETATDYLIQKIEEIGIVVVFSGIYGNNTNRSIQLNDCRGFVLVDEMVPFMFINNNDSKAAQLFTIVHELAHIWIGTGAGFDFRRLQPADDPIELLCDQIAAEFLVPKKEFDLYWNSSNSFKNMAKYFKVSEIVIARRSLDQKKISKTEFINFYESYIQKDFNKKTEKSRGGNFFAITKKRLSNLYCLHVHNALKNGQLLYRDACKLTGLKGDTFQNFFLGFDK